MEKFKKLFNTKNAKILGGSCVPFFSKKSALLFSIRRHRPKLIEYALPVISENNSFLILNLRLEIFQVQRVAVRYQALCDHIH